MFNNFILEKIILPAGDFCLHTTFIKELDYWRNTISKLNATELKELQNQRLQKLLQHTLATIPFYQKQNIQLTGNPYADIKQFPVMHKSLMKQNIHNLLIHDEKKMIKEGTSGSSGIHGEVYMTPCEDRNYQAVQTFLWEWSGYKIGDPILQTGIAINRGWVKLVKDALFKTHYVNAYNLSYENIIKTLMYAKKSGKQFFGGYASSLNLFAEIAIKENINIKFKGILEWGDKLFDHYKKNIQQAFSNPIITELYGTTEGFVISATCEVGNYHLMTPQCYIELLDKDGNEVKPGELGYVVVTRLDALNFPLIRFYLGDLAIKEEETQQCSCGRHFPLLKKVIGRDTDIVHTPNGKPLIVHFFASLFGNYGEITQFRVVQKIKEEIEIEYIPSSTFYPEILEIINQEMFSKAQEKFNIKYIQVNSIPATPSGKPQIIQNLITQKLVS